MKKQTINFVTGYRMSHSMLRQWVLGGLLAAASKFAPIPFVDDFLEIKSKKFIIQRTLGKNRTDMKADVLIPLYDDSGGYFKRYAKRVVKAPLKLIFFPIRKVVRITTSVRSVPLNLIHSVLLGRTLDRCLKSGVFDNLNDKQTKRVAELIRKAFDVEFKHVDFQILAKITPHAWDQITEWAQEFKDMIKKIINKDNREPATSLEASKPIEDLTETFEKPEAISLMEHFDKKFDREFNRLMAGYRKQFA